MRDRHVLRRVTEGLMEDAQVLSTFAALAKPVYFHDADLKKVYFKYLFRVETMMGNEISSQLMEDLKISHVDTLESLRKIKRERSKEVKGQVDEVEAGSNKSKVVKKKRKRRKKKGW